MGRSSVLRFKGATCLTNNSRTASDIVQSLSQRVEELEEGLHAQSTGASASVGVSPWRQQVQYKSPGSASSASAHVSPSTYVSPAASQPRVEPTYTLSRCQLGTNWYFKGLGIVSPRGQQWVYEGAGQHLHLDNLDGSPGSSGLVSRLASIATSPESTGMVLPPEATCRYLFEVFMASKTSIMFPVLEQELFPGTIARAYGDASASDGAPAKACIWAMFALVASMAEAPQLDPIIDPVECIDKVKYLLLVSSGTTNLDTLQASLLMVSGKSAKRRVMFIG